MARRSVSWVGEWEPRWTALGLQLSRLLVGVMDEGTVMGKPSRNWMGAAPLSTVAGEPLCVGEKQICPSVPSGLGSVGPHILAPPGNVTQLLVSAATWSPGASCLQTSRGRCQRG